LENISDFAEENNPQDSEYDYEGDDYVEGYDASKPPALQSNMAAVREAASRLYSCGKNNGEAYFGEAYLADYKLASTMFFEEPCSVYPIGALHFNDHKLTTLLRWIGTTSLPNGGGEAKVVGFEDDYGRERVLAIPLAVLHQGNSAFASWASARGLYVPVHKGAAEKLRELINGLCERTAVVIDRLGWVRGPDSFAFATPGRIIGGSSKDNIVLLDGLGSRVKLGHQGTQEEWQQKVAAKCRGNPRLLLMLATAFSGPLLRFTNVQPTIKHLYGESTVGKTTGLRVAGSVWCRGDDDKLGPAHSWNATANSLMATAADYSGTLLCLDELRVAKNPLELAYTLTSGQGRGRLDKSANQREVQKFETPILSTGEQSFDEMERQCSRVSSVFAGASDVRFPSIPAEPMFEDTHEFADEEEGAALFADSLTTASSAACGWAGPAFAEKLVEHIRDIGENQFRRDLSASITGFVDDLGLDAKADGAVKRLARTFGLDAAAGILASKFGMLPIPGDEISAGIRRCFNDWLMSRGGSRSKTTATALIALRDYIAKNQGRFVALHDATTTQISSLCGYKDGTTFFVLPSSWAEVMASAPRGKLVPELDRLQLLTRQPSSKGAQITKKLPRGPSVRCYAVSSRILEIGENGELSDDADEVEERGNKVVRFDPLRGADRLRQELRRSSR
jgi:putative DNA primase/helicase